MMEADSSRGYALSPEAKRINELESQIMGLHKCMLILEMHLRYRAGASVCADAIANALVTGFEGKT